MNFFGSSFSYDNIPSDQFGLRIAELDAAGVNEMMGISSMEIIEQKLYRRATPYFFGATPSPKLSFQMSAFSEDDMDADLISEVQKSYFSSRSYKRLTIDQPDLMSIYANCILLDPTIIKVGNFSKGISFTVSCDSPFLWHYPKTTTYSFAGAVVDQTVTFNNSSDDTGAYLYPALTITMNSSGGSLSISNSNDGNRTFSFTGLSANEIMTMDCSRQTLKSSTGLHRLSNFNKKFLRLVPGVNTLRIQGGVSRIDMTTQFVAKKI